MIRQTGSGNYSHLKDIVKDKSSAKFQLFLDAVALFTLLGVMTIASIITSDLHDNYLCLFFGVKMMLCVIPFAFTSKKNQTSTQMFFAFRVVLDLISFIGGFILMHHEEILARSYIMLGVVILVELGTSAYCTFMLSKIEPTVADQENDSINGV